MHFLFLPCIQGRLEKQVYAPSSNRSWAFLSLSFPTATRPSPSPQSAWEPLMCSPKAGHPWVPEWVPTKQFTVPLHLVPVAPLAIGEKPQKSCHNPGFL